MAKAPITVNSAIAGASAVLGTDTINRNAKRPITKPVGSISSVAIIRPITKV